MFKLLAALLLGAACALTAAATPRLAGRDPLALVVECRQEALLGHLRVGRLLPLIGPEVDAHRRRMASICLSWLNIERSAAADLLSKCVEEASRGPRVWQHGRDLDRDHVARLKTICRKLAGAANE